MKKFFSHLSFIVFLLFSLVPVAFSDWMVLSTDNAFSLMQASLTPVCYINSDTEQNRYYSIEKALDKASSGDTVYVIPETNPTIKYDCTIKSGVSLTIGGLTKGGSYIKDDKGNYTYKDRGIFDEKDGTSLENSPENRGPHITSNQFADSSDANVKTYRKNSVTLCSTLKIEEKANLNIGGRLNCENIGLSGATSGDYCEIVLQGKGLIQNHGTIDCCGYIKTAYKTSEIQLESFNGSSIYEPFIICDFNGGQYSAACNQKDNTKVIPFNEWLACNVQVNQQINYGCSIYGYYDVYNSSYISKSVLIITVTIKKGHKSGTINMVGTSNSIINLKGGSYVRINVSSTDLEHTIFSGNIVNKNCMVDFYGECEIDKMVIPNPMPDLKNYQAFTNVSIDDMDSSNYLFCMNHYWSGNVYGTLSIATPQKMLPGCQLTVKGSGKLNVNANLIVVENMDEKAAGSTKARNYPTSFNQTNSKVTTNAIINNGTVSIKAGASFGGKIYCQNSNAILDLSSATSLTMQDIEGKSGKMDIPKFNLEYQDAIVENARGPIFNEDDSLSEQNFSKTIYISSQINGEYGYKMATDLDTYTITYHLNGGTSEVSDNETVTYYLLKDQSSTLTEAPISVPEKEHMVFSGWYLDSGLSNPLSNGTVVKNGTALNLYAKYTDRKYKIAYYLYNISGVEATLSNPNTIEEFTYTDLNQSGSFKILDATSSQPDKIIFDGWYTDNTYSQESKLTDNAIMECKDYSLYGRFVKVRPKVTIQFMKYVNDQLVETNKYSENVGDIVNISGYKDASKENINRMATIVEKVSKVEYTFQNWKVTDSSGNEVVLADDTFLPEKENEIYTVVPVYTSTNYLAIVLKNASRKTVFDTYYAITDFQIDGNSLSVKNTDEHVFYVNQNQIIYVKTDNGSLYSYTAQFAINSKENKTINNNSSVTINLKDYKTYFDNLEGPITITGSVKRK